MSIGERVSSLVKDRAVPSVSKLSSSAMLCRRGVELIDSSSSDDIVSNK